MAGSISSLGLGSGLPLQDILSQLRSADEVQLINLQTRKLQYQDQVAEFETVNSKLSSMKSLALDLSLNDTFLTKSASSTDSDIFSASATSSAAATTVSITVDSLAEKNVWQSDVGGGVVGADSEIAADPGSFAYTMDGTQYTVTVEANMTLQELADAINQDEDNPGVTASVMDDGTGSGTDFHLVLSSDATGTDNAITIDTNDTTLVMTEQQVAANAQVTIDNVVYQRATNTLDDIITGVTLNLESTGTSTLTVSNDTSSVKGKIQALFATYNDAVSEIVANSGYDAETGVSGSLNSVSAIRNLKTSLGQIVLGVVDGLTTEYDNLSEIGVAFDQSGLLTLDEDVLDEALASNLEDIQGLFAGDASLEVDGIAAQLYDALVDITKTTDGVISSETERVQAAIDRLDEEIDDTTDLLDSRYAVLEKQFVQLDQILSSLQNEGSALSGIFQNLNDMWVGQD